MRYAVILLLLSLAACTSTLGNYQARVHVVQPGETLYTIAWRHGVDYRSLAAWNNLRNPDLIFAGQRLVLSAPAGTRPTATAGGAGGSGSRTASTSPPARRVPPLPDPPVLPPPQWAWPTRGPVVTAFGSSAGISSGIGIGGRSGQAVHAAATGRVVYAGGGLIGYGQLVIIKHNDTYLTAYGHNNRLLVAQGQDVRRGEQIAEMGLGPQRQPRLHFEIRRNGRPVDPLPLLGSPG